MQGLVSLDRRRGLRRVTRHCQVVAEGDLDIESANRIVVPVRKNDNEDVATWSRAISAELHHRESSFQRAAETRRRLAVAKSWKDTIADLTAKL